MTDSATNSDAKKRLGQYFTEPSVARLLAELAIEEDPKTVVDPMVGIGSMLKATLEAGAKPRLLAGVEIDPAVASIACDQLPRSVDDGAVRIASGNVFSSESWQDIGHSGTWDLVITNPPYVRYQASSTEVAGINVPTFNEVRSGLADMLDRMDLPADERLVFKTLAASYSGLADIAVPSWILVLALARRGGRVAAVVPEAWLTREYALPVQYLVARFLNVETVVRDLDSAWFPDALVRTNLIIGSRVSRSSITDITTGPPEVHVGLTARSVHDKSAVGGLFPDSPSPEADFAHAVGYFRRHAEGGHHNAVFELRPQGSRLDAIGAKLTRQPWFVECEPTGGRESGSSAVDTPTRIGLAAGPALPDLVGLQDIGWNVGQGLRTGANSFFYVRRIRTEGGREIVQPDPRVFEDEVPVAPHLLRPAVRRQKDVNGNSRTAESVDAAILDLGSVALPEDLAALADADAPSLVIDTFKPMSPELAEFVRRAAVVNLGNAEAPRHIPKLSAVAPNHRDFDPERPERLPRFWYQLPTFTARHQPDLFVPRVNHRFARPYANPHRRLLVDANFVTLWHEQGSWPPETVLALLSSSWTAAWLEETGTVLGGGALKVEASTFRDLGFPLLSSAALNDLKTLGGTLSTAGDHARILGDIDAVIARHLGVEENVMRSTADTALGERAGSTKHYQSRAPWGPVKPQPASHGREYRGLRFQEPTVSVEGQR